MKKIGIIIFIVALVAGIVLANMSSFGRLSSSFVNVSLNFGAVSGSGNVVTQNRDVSNFKAIDVSGVFKVEAVAQKDFEVAVQADDNLMPFIKTEVRGDTLYIESEKRLKSSGPIIIRISAPEFTNVEASGATNISVKDLNSNELGLNSSGASKVLLQGLVNNLVVDVSGASNIDAGDLAAQTAKVDASGACSVSVNVSNHLDVDASGASKIFYSGTVKSENIVKSTSGASRVVQK
ncbi:MAG: head GIN domain-containing protein [Acidobacteriota bacterium]